MNSSIRQAGMVVAVVMAGLLLGSTVLARTWPAVGRDKTRGAANGEAANGERGPTVEKAPAPGIDRQLESEIEQYVEGRTGVYGVAIRDLDTGQTVLLNADGDFPSASTYKVLVMYRVYQALEAGRLSADDTVTITSGDTQEGADGGLYPGEVVAVADALELMITESSNTAAYALTRLVGGWSRIDAAAVELGMSQTGLGSDYYFWTSPADMLTFFEALAEGSLVSSGASRRMVRLLMRQTANDRIPALLPFSASVAHKTGELPGVRNDAGIVYGPGGGYAIAVFSQAADTVPDYSVGGDSRSLWASVIPLGWPALDCYEWARTP